MIYQVKVGTFSEQNEAKIHLLRQIIKTKKRQLNCPFFKIYYLVSAGFTGLWALSFLLFKEKISGVLLPAGETLT